GRKIESHADLWTYKNEVVKELGEWVRTAFMKADSMHKNFYENLATKEDVKDALEEVNKLVSSLGEKLSSRT
ncbi:MAG: PaREP1 family protein, partial [Candidatus Bathyarchaeia archaeon]